jgi:hypothetical protein
MIEYYCDSIARLFIERNEWKAVAKFNPRPKNEKAIREIFHIWLFVNECG